MRFCSVDAAWSIEHLVAPASVTELWTFFPDPWRKTKHHKRRLVNATTAAIASSRLVPGGVWRLATDWADYADQMSAVLDAEPTLEGGREERWAERPVTRFERKGLEIGREIVDLAYRRPGPSRPRVGPVGRSRQRLGHPDRTSVNGLRPGVSGRLSRRPQISPPLRFGVGVRSLSRCSGCSGGSPGCGTP